MEGINVSEVRQFGQVRKMKNNSLIGIFLYLLFKRLV